MQSRPRVLAVAQSARAGGAELALQRIAERLPELGFAVEMASPARHSAPDAAFARGHRGPGASDQLHRAPAGSDAPHRLAIGGLDPGGWPRALASWPRAHRLARQFDLVLLNGIVTQRLAPAMTGSTIVPYIHELSDSPPRAWRSARFWMSAPVVLCACEAVARRCRALGAPGDRLRTVYAPVSVVPPTLPPVWLEEPVVGYVGRIEPEKGSLDLVRAMQSIDAKLVIIGAGSGPYAEQVRGEGDDVLFLGQIEDARGLMEWFDLLVVPSHREAFGTVAAEALAAGTPVVATRGGGIEEYVVPGENGDLVMPGDVEGLSKAIQALLPRVASMAGAARASVARFDADLVAADVADALREALSRRAWAPRIAAP